MLCSTWKCADILDFEVSECGDLLNLEVGECIHDLPLAWCVWKRRYLLHFQIGKRLHDFNLVVGKGIHILDLAVNPAHINFGHLFFPFVCLTRTRSAWLGLL